MKRGTQYSRNSILVYHPRNKILSLTVCKWFYTLIRLTRLWLLDEGAEAFLGKHF